MKSDNTLMIKTAVAIAAKIKADAVFIHIDPLDDLTFNEPLPRKRIPLILMSRKKREEETSLSKLASGQITLPKTSMTRLSLIKAATSLAISDGTIAPGTKLVFVVGQSEIGLLDLIQIVDTSKESEIMAGKGLSSLSDIVHPELFQAVLNLTMELADKGREGKPVGTIFVLGDHEKVLQLSRQMIMNPFKGYEEEERHILDSSIKETIREFSALDGAFIISDEGVIITAGRYLGVASEESNLPRGLGSRHMAAAGITKLTKAIAFVISESSGDVRIFRDGQIVMNLEKRQPKK